MQKLSNILHPSRQNWTTEDWFFLQKEVNSIKYLSQLLSHLLLYPGLSQWKLLSSPYIIPPWLFQTHPPTKSGKSQIFFLIEHFPNYIEKQLIGHLNFFSKFCIFTPTYYTFLKIPHQGQSNGDLCSWFVGPPNQTKPNNAYLPLHDIPFWKHHTKDITKVTSLA